MLTSDLKLFASAMLEEVSKYQIVKERSNQLKTWWSIELKDDEDEDEDEDDEEEEEDDYEDEEEDDEDD